MTVSVTDGGQLAVLAVKPDGSIGRLPFAGDALFDVGLHLTEAGHGAHFQAGAVFEHQHHVAIGAKAAGHRAHLFDLGVGHLAAVAAQPASGHRHPAAGHLETQPQGTNNRANGKGQTNQGDAKDQVDDQITACRPAFVVDLLFDGRWGDNTHESVSPARWISVDHSFRRLSSLSSAAPGRKLSSSQVGGRSERKA